MTFPLTRSARRRFARSSWLVGLLPVALASLISAHSADAPVHPDYSTFRVITERNIFNAGRSGRTNRGTRESTARPSRVVAFTLVGTLSSGQGLFAFFDSSDSDLRKALKPQDSIAGHRITNIAPNSVTLEADGKSVELRVGMQLRREDDGPWQAAERQDSSERHDSRDGPRSLSDSGANTPSGSSTSPAPNAEESEVLKRLMQQREKDNP
jgi:hypothetical protein